MSNIKAKYLVIDTETTGLFASKNGLIQLAAVVLDQRLEILAEFNEVVCPPEGVEISNYSLELTGFTMEKIQSGISYLQLGEKFLAFLKSNFAEKPVTIGQFYPFDYSFMEQVFSQVGFGQKICQDILSNDFIDTKALVNFVNLKAEFENKPKPFSSTSLSKPGGLKESLQTEGIFKAHDAMGDVLATREVLLKLLPLIEFKKK